MSNVKRGVKRAMRFLPRALPIIFCASLLVPHAVEAADPGEAVLPFLAQMESAYAKVNDYQATFHKQERVDGKLLPEETILLKFQKPLKIYMNWVGEPLRGQEALYVQGKYDNKLVAHAGGVLGMISVSVDPDGPTAMEGNRHPITHTGFGFIIKQLRPNIESALSYGEFEIVRMGEESFQGRPATVIEAVFDKRGERQYSSGRMVLHIDRELMLPVGSVFYDGKNTLIEKYYYTDVKLNVGFTDADFSRDKYRF
jgi:outer membrane lipoprotein-sorting protein